MSILKAILHHWNKTNKEYDILHPQTDSSMVTDWNAGIVNTLASTALGSLISTLSSDSLAAKIVKLVLDATGVNYLMATSGYIKFGSLFGGLIIQWGTFQTNKANNSETTLPIAFASELYVVVITDTASGGYPLVYGVYQLSSKSFYSYSRRSVTSDIESVTFGRWIAIGH